MESPRYKFVYAKKNTWKVGTSDILLLSAKEGSPRAAVTAREYALAELFDGSRSEEEVMDDLFKQNGYRIPRQTFDRLVARLLKFGLLQETDLSALKTVAHAGERVSNAHYGAAIDARHKRPRQPKTASKFDYLQLKVDNKAKKTSLSDAVTARATEKSARKRMLRLPVAWLLPLFSVFALPLYSALFMFLLIGASLLFVYGLTDNRIEVLHDLQRMFQPLTLVQTLLLSMFSVNLFSQLLRAQQMMRYTKMPPSFGITLALNFIPRFSTDLAKLPAIANKVHQRRVLATTLVVAVELFVVGAMGWFFSRGSGTFLPLLCLAVAALSAVTFLIQINPLARSDGYYLLTNCLRVADLREQALLALVGKGRQANAAANKTRLAQWPMRVYGFAIVGYLVLISSLIVVVLGGWLEVHWGGLGVIVFLAIVAIALRGAIQQAKARERQRSRFAFATRPAPGFSATFGHRSAIRKRLAKYTKIFVSLIVIAVLSIIPYAYEPAGEFELLPEQRADVRSLIAGDIKEIYVAEGDRVEKGAVLARLSADEEKKNVAVFRSKVTELEAKLKMAEEGATPEQIASARQQVETAKSRYDFSRKEALRFDTLFQRKLVAAQEYEDAQARAKVDRQLLVQAERDFDLVKRAVRGEEIDVIRAEIAQQRAQLEYHEQQLHYTALRAPFTGRIVSGSLLFAVGNYLNQGEIFAIVESTQTLLAQIEIPQADINEVRVGAPVRIKTWTYPEKEFYGSVQSIAPNAQDSDYGKVVRVQTEIDNREGLLKPELTGYAKISGEERPAILAFTRMLIRFFQIELWSWLP